MNESTETLLQILEMLVSDLPQFALRVIGILSDQNLVLSVLIENKQSTALCVHPEQVHLKRER